MSEMKPMDWALPVRMFESEFWVSADQVMARQQHAKEEIDRLTAERDDALAAADSKAGWEWKKRAEKAEAERDAAVAERDAVRNAIGNDMLKTYIEKHGDPIPLVLELASYKVDASRWNELCRQVDLTMFPYEILDDAMAMGAGALEIYIDEAMKEQEQCK